LKFEIKHGDQLRYKREDLKRRSAKQPGSWILDEILLLESVIGSEAALINKVASGEIVWRNRECREEARASGEVATRLAQ
jgi:hypothetical protein